MHLKITALFSSRRAGRARRRRARSAATLVCVLVVMLIVGLLSAQSIQMLLLVRRADEQRVQLRQARELLELGKLAIAQRAIPDDGMLRLSVAGQPAVVTITQLDAEATVSPTERRYAVHVAYRAGQPQELNVSWESP